MRRKGTLTLMLCVASVALLYQTGGGGSSSGGPTTPSASGSGGGGGGSASTAPVVITIVGNNGNRSFSPNPATVPKGQTVVWMTADTDTHDIVEDGGGFDTGELVPSATGAPVIIGSDDAVSYHCSLHPEMVGGINGSSGNSSGGPGYYIHHGH